MCKRCVLTVGEDLCNCDCENAGHLESGRCLECAHLPISQEGFL